MESYKNYEQIEPKLKGFINIPNILIHATSIDRSIDQL